jgi:hypothetical protein
MVAPKHQFPLVRWAVIVCSYDDIGTQAVSYGLHLWSGFEYGERNTVFSKNVKLRVLARNRGGVVLAITAVAAAVQVA